MYTYRFPYLSTDDIEFGGARPDVKNILGGAASFAVVGARLVAEDAHAQSVSWIVDVGSDFPLEALDVIKSWGTNCVIREDKGRLTTRAWNGYGANEKRGWYPLVSLNGTNSNANNRFPLSDPEAPIGALDALRVSSVFQDLSHGLFFISLHVHCARYITATRKAANAG